MQHDATRTLFENYYNTRTRVESPFKDILDELCGEMYMRPELPIFKYKKDKVVYEFSDLRLMNPIFVSVTDNIIAMIRSHNYDSEGVTVKFTGWSIKELNVIADVVGAQTIKAKKKGKNGFELTTSFLTCGAGISDNQICFHVIESQIKCVEEWDTETGLTGLIESIVKSSREEIYEHIV